MVTDQNYSGSRLFHGTLDDSENFRFYSQNGQKLPKSVKRLLYRHTITAPDLPKAGFYITSVSVAETTNFTTIVAVHM